MPKQTPQRETQMTWWATLIFGWAIFLFWAVLAGPAPFLVRTRDLRRRTGALADATGGPTITVIIPARDEAAGIEANLRSLLASDYSDLEIVAVNDRSQDETGTIMERLAIEEGRLRVIHIQELPDGWLGKCHAMHLGAEAAHGELLLFTDGDVIFAPETIRRAAWYLQRTDTDHLCLMPHLIPGGYWESAFVSFFGMIFWMGTQPWLVPTSLKRAYVGVGAFNLVRKRVYDAIGGHTPIRLDVLDDVKLGKLIKNSGYRPDCLFAGELLRVRWQSSFWQSICGLEKNGFAAQDYSLVRMIALTITALTVGLVGGHPGKGPRAART